MQVRKATTGIKMELLIKSKKSKIDMPNGLILDQSPKPREDGIPSRTLTPKVRNAALRRDRLVLVPNDGDDCLHQGNRRGQSGKQYQKEKDRADRCAKRHVGEYLRQSDKH